MKHIMFPTAADADAFIADVQGQGLGLGQATYARRANSGSAQQVDTEVNPEGGTAEDAGAGAVKGTVVGAVTGAAAGLIGTAAAVATGGLAIPVILGMAALGSGVGAGVGALGGAAGVDETDHYYEASDGYYDRMSGAVSGGGRVVGIDDNAGQEVMDAAARHGGQVMDSTDTDMSRVNQPYGGSYSSGSYVNGEYTTEELRPDRDTPNRNMR